MSVYVGTKHRNIYRLAGKRRRYEGHIDFMFKINILECRHKSTLLDFFEQNKTTKYDDGIVFFGNIGINVPLRYYTLNYSERALCPYPTCLDTYLIKLTQLRKIKLA